MIALADRIEEAQKRGHERAGDAYRKLVTEATTEGADVDPAKAARVLADAGKTAADLRDDVTRLQQRKADAAKVALAPMLITELEKIDVKIGQTDAEFHAAMEKRDTTAGPWLERATQIRQSIQDAERARERLQATCTDRNLLDELNRIAQQRIAHCERKKTLMNEASKSRVSESTARDAANRTAFMHTDTSKGYLIEAKEHADRAATLEGQVTTIAGELAALTKQEAAIFEKMLQP